MATKYTTDFSGKRILVVGGTSGMGYSVAEACTEFGATVIVSSSRQSSIDNTISRLLASYPSAKGRVVGKTCDLAGDTVEASVEALYEFATEGNTHKIDHVVFTAGDRFKLVTVKDATPELLHGLGNVRLIGMFMVAKYAMKYMRLSVESSFTVTSGVNSFKPLDGFSVMAAFGAAIDGATKGLAKDMRPVRVNCVSPGAINTELVRGDATGAELDATLERYGKMSLTNTVGKPEEVAETYIHLMKNGFMTGTTVHVEGGFMLR